MRLPPRRGRSPFAGLTSRLTPAVTWIIGIHIAAFLLFMFSGKPAQAALADWLLLTPAALLDGHVWKLVTTAIFTVNGLAFFIDLLVLWMFMPFLERAWGMRRFLIVALASTVISYLAASLLGLALGGVWAHIPLSGLTPFIYAGIAAYGTEYAEQPISFFGVVPMKGKTLAIGIAVLVVLALVINGNWVEGTAHIVGLITGWAMTTTRLTPRIWLLKWRRDRLRRRYTVLDGGRGDKKWMN